ncbi:uncharacterized protein LOC129751316 isoform X2 [Uranotaenia lowii]|nr:uncharacterized protein LOC129751316 isoform X2 [Uranotaenia lowii]
MEVESGDPDSGLYPFHPSLFDVCEDEKPPKADVTLKNIYEPRYGGTELHRAIKRRNKSRIENVLNMYLADFDTVREYLVQKYDIDSNDNIWFRKTILVASTEEQCSIAKNFERECVPQSGLNEAILVLLQHPIDGERVSVLHPNESNRLEALRIVTSLIPNGFLSWNYSLYENQSETIIEVAAECGNIELIQRLYEIGIELSVPYHNPLLAAVRNNRVDTVEWLLTEHFDHFDCSARSFCQENAVEVAMHMKKTLMMKYCLEKMLAYRQKYFNETEIDAFNKIFRFKDSTWTYLPISKYRKLVEQWISDYKLDLSYRLGYVFNIKSLIECQCALEYCWNGIRLNPDLLGLNMYETATILHLLVEKEYFEFLKEMYECYPRVKQYFETDEAWRVLDRAIGSDQHGQIQFILNHHSTFLKKDLDELKSVILKCRYYENKLHQQTNIIKRYFSEFEEDFKKLRNEEIYRYRCADDLDHSFIDYDIQCHDSDIEIPGEIGQLYDVRGIKGESLLHLAVQKNDKDFLIRLLEEGCDFDALDNFGNHAIHYVRNVEMLELILERHPAGKDLVRSTNAEGYSVLHKISNQRMYQECYCELIEK